ncbi:TetR/AcrR family transcriptional regulator [Pseudonocardia spirodelae]|uniref:Helix-turn-helix domain-containing protein n=1 Tax=Pseudonocardia spirodelae TaxID=3133431 RepID=A0ABU8T6E9_9PSEU
MATRAPDPRGARSRALLYDAATALFAERGFAATTMDDVAQRAGLSRRTAFNHFPSKGELAVEWAARRQAAATAAAGEPGPGDHVPDRIRAWFRALGELTDADPDGTEQMMLGWLAALGPVHHRTPAVHRLAEWLDAGRDGGGIASTVDPGIAADLLFDAYLGAVLRWCAVPPGRRGPLTPVLEALVEQVMAGLAPR